MTPRLVTGRLYCSQMSIPSPQGGERGNTLLLFDRDVIEVVFT